MVLAFDGGQLFHAPLLHFVPCSFERVFRPDRIRIELLKQVGKLKKPVLLKRGMSATVEELLMAAEYILGGGNTQVVLCERGVRTFADHTRNTLDLSAIPVVKRLSHLPIIVDPIFSGLAWTLIL